ncbi:DUF1799 domain-containing protein [Herbaspirillum seropedicae]|uniref:DUF1799 domain-containing protein n=1 Tax=Herbaspirillum seropedicae TaxID=964 RepID=UPI002856CA3E|nr:DUF1799 domain-containing protein [Herbaspirillum seropedicae]MDR6394628.1 hypothetical protein [Herbaspirillum seropedicae]
MYRPEPDKGQLAAIGLKPSDFGPAALIQDVFPENMPAVDLFQTMDTQWRTGMGGVQGLDYGVLPSVLRLMEIPESQWKSLFSDLRVMEMAVLEMLQES